MSSGRDDRLRRVALSARRETAADRTICTPRNVRLQVASRARIDGAVLDE
jgi:hypothetical protein